MTIKNFYILTFFTFVLFITSSYCIFLYAPIEVTMGAVQKIFYWHVPSAIASYLCFAIVLVCSIIYLNKSSFKTLALLEAAGSVGFLFCTMVLLSGMIWGKAAWNTWFNWEPRLVTFLLLWLIFLSFNLVAKFVGSDLRGNQLAVIGIIGAVTVPIMVFSIKLLPQIAQLHPEIIEKRGLTSEMELTLIINILSFILLTIVFLSLSYKINLLAYKSKKLL